MKPSRLHLRQAAPGDRDAIDHCVQAAYALYVERIGKPPAPMLADYGDLIDRRAVWVATLSEELVGLLTGWPKSDHWYLDALAVDPQFQGFGAGAALLGLADHAARKAHRSEIRLYTNEKMTENLTYYPHMGYQETHRAHGEGYDRVYFARSVPSLSEPSPSV